MLALQLDGDCLDQRIVRESVLDASSNRLDQLEELVWIHLVVADEQDVREDVFVALVEFVEEHGRPRSGRDWMESQYRTRPARSPVGLPASGRSR